MSSRRCQKKGSVVVALREGQAGGDGAARYSFASQLLPLSGAASGGCLRTQPMPAAGLRDLGIWSRDHSSVCFLAAPAPAPAPSPCAVNTGRFAHAFAMAGLVSYASSDDDDDAQEELVTQKKGPSAADAQDKAGPQRDASQQTAPGPRPLSRGDATEAAEKPHDAGTLEEPEPAPGPAPGPAPEAVTRDVLIGPARPVGAALPPAYEEDMADDGGDAATPGAPPLSPYSAERALLRQLTLPRVPDFAIPGSPPGTPPPGQAALDGKFETFLALKRDKATHFNARLAQSGAMKNPATMDKLMAFVGLEAPGPAQYGTVLSADVWNPAPAAPAAPAKQETTDQPTPLPASTFPEWAYRTQLRKVQEDLARKRARAPGERVEFVAASGSVPPAGMGKRKSRFD